MAKAPTRKKIVSEQRLQTYLLAELARLSASEMVIGNPVQWVDAVLGKREVDDDGDEHAILPDRSEMT